MREWATIGVGEQRKANQLRYSAKYFAYAQAGMGLDGPVRGFFVRLPRRSTAANQTINETADCPIVARPRDDVVQFLSSNEWLVEWYAH